MSNESDDHDQLPDGRGTTNPVYSAVARSLTRGAALYFSGPIRLFRPSKSKCRLITASENIIYFFRFLSFFFVLSPNSDLQAKSVVGSHSGVSLLVVERP